MTTLTYQPRWNRWPWLHTGETLEFCDDLPRLDGVRNHRGRLFAWMRPVDDPDRATQVDLAEVVVTTHQPREQPVPCQMCGVNPRTRRPRTMTMSLDALCDRHAEVTA